MCYYMTMNKSLIIDTLLATLLCAIFQTLVSLFMLIRNNIVETYIPELLLISFVFAFGATFVPLLAFNLYKNRRK